MENLLKRLPLHIAYVVLFALLYQFFNSFLLGDDLMGQAFTVLGPIKIILIDLGAGAFFYALFCGARETIRERRALRNQLARMPFQIRLLKMSDPMGMAMSNMHCGVSDCDGFLASARNEADREGVFCLRCSRTVTKNEFDGLLHIGARLGFE